MWGPKIVLLWCSDWLKIVILWHSIACKSEIYAAQCRSLLQEEAAAEDASRAAVHVESCDTMCSRKAQCQAPPDNPETGDMYERITSRERGCAGEKIENRAPRKRNPSGTATTTRHTTASNIIIGWNLYEYVGSLLLLLPQRVALCVTTRSRPRQTRHVLPEGRGVAQFLLSWQPG